MNTDYAKWAKYDVDADLEEVDKREEKVRCCVTSAQLGDQQRLRLHRDAVLHDTQEDVPLDCLQQSFCTLEL